MAKAIDGTVQVKIGDVWHSLPVHICTVDEAEADCTEYVDGITWDAAPSIIDFLQVPDEFTMPIAPVVNVERPVVQIVKDLGLDAIVLSSQITVDKNIILSYGGCTTELARAIVEQLVPEIVALIADYRLKNSKHEDIGA